MAYGLDAMRSSDPPDSPLLQQTEIRNLSFGTQDFDRLLRPLVKIIDDMFRGTIYRFGHRTAPGINLSNYNKFLKLTPTLAKITRGGAVRLLPGEISFAELVGWKPNDRIEDARWCIEFVTDFMLRLERSREGAIDASDAQTGA
jgi:hypothetical protein